MGKRWKWRTGFFPLRAVDALRVHSADHGTDFEDSKGEMTRLASAAVSTTKTAQAKHLFVRDTGLTLTGNGFSVTGRTRL
ncbi:hypothetical protein [Paraburkholderia dipogonis]|uniref:hypothetical protein n=1 Tax=Paraburkholderia dipogonis TaxID=1211383 RepID=UPI0038B7A1C2